MISGRIWKMSGDSCKKQIIISDTSCLIGLTNIGLLEVLHQLWNEVIITPEVADEFGEKLPDWIKVTSVINSSKTAIYNKFMGSGESSSIALAAEVENPLLILDDWQARQFATNLGFAITGTAGLLAEANRRGIIPDYHRAISKLRANGFRLPEEVDKLME
jgi:predicted nucleic acid-binding protein